MATQASEFSIIEPAKWNEGQFVNLIVVGEGANPCDAKADGDIIFGTRSQSLVFSKDGIYFNGELKSDIDDELKSVIRDAMLSVSAMMRVNRQW
jgi:hypothetical protein